MDCSFLCIFFRSKGQNSDTWNFIQFCSFEKVYNQVILGDCAEPFPGESNFDHTGGIGKRTQRATIGHDFRTYRFESTELQWFQDRAPKIKKR